jgi:hypothetical protein
MDENKTASAKPPSHIAYQVRETEEGKVYFNRVGSAFAHKDGKGFNLILDATPVDGRVTLRTPLERLAEPASTKERGDQDRER